MPLRPGITKAVLLLSGGRCRYCGGLATAADHIVPQCDGGTDEPSNLTAACKPCNSSKGGARLPPDIEEELLTEAWIVAEEVKRLAGLFQNAQKAAAKRPKIVISRGAYHTWKPI